MSSYKQLTYFLTYTKYCHLKPPSDYLPPVGSLYINSHTDWGGFGTSTLLFETPSLCLLPWKTLRIYEV